MTYKDFNLFHECTARCVHLFPQEEGCSKIYTSDSLVNAQRMLTEVNEIGAIAKIRIWVESDTVKH